MSIKALCRFSFCNEPCTPCSEYCWGQLLCYQCHQTTRYFIIVSVPSSADKKVAVGSPFSTSGASGVNISPTVSLRVCTSNIVASLSQYIYSGNNKPALSWPQSSFRVINYASSLSLVLLHLNAHFWQQFITKVWHRAMILHLRWCSQNITFTDAATWSNFWSVIEIVFLTSSLQ